jgi:hypothetical protein
VSAAERLFGEWFAGEWGDDAATGVEFNLEDLGHAFAGGFAAAMSATWQPGGRPVHPGAQAAQVYYVLWHSRAGLPVWDGPHNWEQAEASTPMRDGHVDAFITEHHPIDEAEPYTRGSLQPPDVGELVEDQPGPSLADALKASLAAVPPALRRLPARDERSIADALTEGAERG